MDTIQFIAQRIYEKKGFNIFAVDVRGLSSMTDYLIIAEGNVDRHVLSIAEELSAELKEKGEVAIHIDGKEEGDWVVMDYGNFMIHLFTQELRSKYQLERLFPKGKIIDLQLNTSYDEQISG